MKRILSLVLVLLLLASTLTACQTSPAEETPAATASAPVEETASSNPASWLCNDKTTLTVFTYDAVNNTYPAPSNDLPFWQFLEDYTNVHINWEVVPYSGYPEVVATKVSSGSDMPDIMVTNDMKVSNDGGNNGLFVNLADSWDTCFTKTQQYMDENGIAYKSLVSNQDGSIYGFSGTVEPVEGHIVFLYNTEWLNKLGATVPQTLDEFTALLQQMKEAGDINGNGQNDEVILTSSNVDTLTSVLGNAFGLEQYEGWDAFVADQSGTVTNEYTSDNMKNYLTYMNGLFSSGLLDNEICTMTADSLSEKIASDRVGVFVYYSAFAITYGSLTSAGIADPKSEHYTLGSPLASEYNGNQGYFVRREKLGNGVASVSSSSENKELAMKWLDTLLADPEVLKVRTCGFEGEDWQLDSSGNFQLIYPADGSAWQIMSKGCGQITPPFIQTKDQLLNSKRQYQWYMDEYAALRDNAKWVSPSVVRVSCFTDDEQDELDYCKTDVLTYWQEMRDKFIKGEASLSTGWDTFVSTMGELGLDTFTKVYQSVYDRTK